VAGHGAGTLTRMGLSQIAVDVLHLTFAVYIALVLLRVAAQLLKGKLPAAAHAIEFATGK
jgi:hypothetical protein